MLELLAGNPALCDTLANNPTLIEVSPEDEERERQESHGGFTRLAAGAAVRSTDAEAAVSLLPAMVRQHDIAALLAAQPAVAAAAAGSAALRQLLAAYPAFAPMLAGNPEVARALVDFPALDEALEADDLLREAVLKTPQVRTTGLVGKHSCGRWGGGQWI